MYRVRFIFTTDICGAWHPFGGLSTQMDNVFAPMRLAEIENIFVSLAYYDLLFSRLDESSRAREDRAVGAVDFVDLLSTERARFKAHAVDQ